MRVKGAHSYTMGICANPRCTALHFELKDEEGRYFAHMTIPADDVPQVTEKMKDLAYEIHTMKGEKK